MFQNQNYFLKSIRIIWQLRYKFTENEDRGESLKNCDLFCSFTRMQITKSQISYLKKMIDMLIADTLIGHFLQEPTRNTMQSSEYRDIC